MIRINKTPGLALAAAVWLAGCGVSQSKPEKATVEPATAVAAFPLAKDIFSASLRTPGELQAFQQVDLYAKVSSFVRKLNVDVGSTVQAGQVLATMEAPELGSAWPALNRACARRRRCTSPAKPITTVYTKPASRRAPFHRTTWTWPSLSSRAILRRKKQPAPLTVRLPISAITWRSGRPFPA